MGYSEQFERAAYNQAGSMHGQKHYKRYAFRAKLATWGKTLGWLTVCLVLLYCFTDH